MLLNLTILATVFVTALILWSPLLHRSVTWRAMTTPLASIIGSGFLVLGPILIAAYGAYAPLVMGALCLCGYLFGAAIRYTMRTAQAGALAVGQPYLGRIDAAAAWALGFAYVVSVTFYLNLFGAFAVSLTPFATPLAAKLVTSAVFAVIAAVGWTRGFESLERMQYASVTVKLAIIAGLFAGLAIHTWGKVAADAVVFNPATQTGWSAITLAFGLIITVQGFETSRYLSADYDRATRIASMRWSQWLSAAIYMAYVMLIAFVFRQERLDLTESAIVDMMATVAPVLPGLLVAAALAAQFSAAVADTSGSGGLIAELTANRLSPRVTYVILTVIGLALTWTADVFQIISHASRAFALYYGLQAALAMVKARRNGDMLHALAFGALAVLGLMIVVFGQPIKG